MLLPNVQRPLPSTTDDLTHEYIHPSILEQPKLSAHLSSILEANPGIVGSLFPLEEGFKMNWPFSQDSIAARTYSSELEQQMTADALTPTLSIMRSASRFSSSIRRSLSSSGRRQKLEAAAGLPRASEELLRRSEDLPRRKSEDKRGDAKGQDVSVVRVSSESHKLKKIRRQSTPLPSISVVAGH